MRSTLVAMVVCLAASTASAQPWTAHLPQKPEGEMTVEDVRRAFEAWAREHGTDVRKESARPKFRFAPQEEKEKQEFEVYKLFKRWEWLVEPRAYPSGRLDHEKIDAERARVAAQDDSLVMKQRDANPLGLRFEGERALFPPLPFWTLMGPSDAVGGTNLGRVNCIEFDPLNSKTIYIGAPDGGVWKTTDAGATWASKFDTQPTLSVGDIAIDHTNTQIVYAATSDAFGYGVPFWGGTYSIGVRKSTDGGSTWAATGLNFTLGQNRTIRRLVIHPTDGKILLAATSNGLYRTGDAGATWTQVWATSTYDAEFQQNNGAIVYATTSQVFKSTDAGATFGAGVTSCAGSRYNIEIARSNPKVLYTLCTNGTVQRSTDAGATWAATAAPGVTLYGYYDNVLAVSPVNEKVAYVAGFNIKKTTDAGATWSAVPVAGHVDNHALEFAPGSGTTILGGNDGGLFKTINSGTTWTSLNKGLAITQFYRMSAARTSSGTLLAGAQDNGNMKLAASVWSNVTNADGMDGFIDWSNALVMYAGTQNGVFYRSTDGGGSWVNINTPSGGAWVSPWMQDPITANTIYAGTDKVYKSTNQGTAWTAISPSLAGIGAFTVLEVAPSNPKFIYAGDGNQLYKTTNGGTTWTDITAGLPVAGNFLTDVAVHDYDPNQVYVTFSGYNAGEKVYKTCSGGASWNNISGTLPNMPANTIVHQKTNNGLYVGTDAGVYYLNDDLTDWVPYKLGLPNVIVDDLDIHYGANKIRAATYGRGVWQAPLK